MKKVNFKQEIKDFGEYISEGQEEVGKEMGMEVKATNIYSLNRGKMPDAVFVLQQFCRDLSKRKNYSANTYRVLMHLFGLSQYENYVSIDVKSISEDIGMNESSVKRATKTLEKDNIIIKIKHPSDRRRIDYFINPMAAWRGKAINRTKSIKKLEDKKQQLDMFSDSL